MALTSSEKVIRFRKRIKIALVASFGGKCQICGLEDEPYMYDFHHINPAEKSFGIAASGESRSKDRVADEASKCLMVCGNCHRRIGNNGIDVSDYLTVFNRDLFFTTIEALKK